MKVKDKSGRPVYITIHGNEPDALYIDEVYYLDTPMSSDENVSDEMIEWIQEAYADAIYQEWCEDQSSRAEALAESREDR